MTSVVQWIAEGNAGVFQTDPFLQLLALRDKHGQIKSRGGRTHAPQKNISIFNSPLIQIRVDALGENQKFFDAS